jgi:tetratricopeptide (TPR) repeat protein
MSAEKEFPEVHWDEMKSKMEEGGADAVIEFINGFDDEERRKLYSFAQQSWSFYGREWEGKNLDDYIVVAEAGITEGLRQAEAATDPEEANRLKDFANVLSYNVSADLAECWPGDEVPREQRHFEAGLKAAEDCLRWREELGKGPLPFALAYWAKGMHQMSLGDNANAAKNFRKAFDYGTEYAKDEGISPDVSPEGDLLVILGAGYIGLAEWVAGDKAAGKAHYDETITAFQAQVENYPDKKDGAQFGFDQLEWVKAKFIK